jgi:hypothetical protein
MLHYSTSDITVGTTSYVSRLKKVNSIKNSRDRKVDRAELVLDNADLSVGDALFEADELLDNARAVLSWIYVNVWDDSEIYQITRMGGLLYTFSEEGSADLNVTLIADDYAGGGVAPFEVRQTCVWKYKDGINCDYAGALATCDFSFNGTNGCVVHFGTEMAKARFGGGALDLDDAVVGQFGIYDTGNDPNGGLDTGLCFLAGTPVYVDENFTEVPIEKLEAGPILGLTPATLEPAPDTATKPLLVDETRFFFRLLFSDGTEIGATAEHPFYPEPGRRVRVRDFEIGMKFRRLTKSGWRTVSLIRMTPVTLLDPVKVYNQPADETHSYFAAGFPVSNLKNRQNEFPTGFNEY